MEKAYVQAIDPRVIGNIRTNFNPCRQRSLSGAQSTVLTVAQIVGVGDLSAIAEAADANGEIMGCKVGYGNWEPANDAGWKRFGEGPDFADHWETHTIRITRAGRKAAWVELTYDDDADVEAVLAAVGARSLRWETWDEERRAEEAKRPLYEDIPF